MLPAIRDLFTWGSSSSQSCEKPLPEKVPRDYTNADLKAIWEETETHCKAGRYDLKGKTIQLEPFLSDCVKGTFKRTDSLWRWFIEFLFGKTYHPRGHQTEITVINQDALETAILLKQTGFNPALLNPANAHTPGGGYLWGARAMEEDICRRSGLAFAIDSSRGKVPNRYPLEGAELLYSPNVPIFRHGRDQDYSAMDAPVPVAVITSAAIDLNASHKADKAYVNNSKAFEKETSRRIYAQLAVAADQKNDAVVLIPFGCGAFCNPPEVVAKIYKHVIETHFKGVFKKIMFAVIDDHNCDRSGRTHNPQGNYIPFKECFEPAPIRAS